MSATSSVVSNVANQSANKVGTFFHTGVTTSEVSDTVSSTTEENKSNTGKYIAVGVILIIAGIVVYKIAKRK